MGFTTGLSGVKAANTDLRVTGNNIANASTIGFKASRTEFGDAYTNSILGMGRDPIGSGVHVNAVAQKFNQGNISSTESALDLAIDGKGFFVLRQGGDTVYTRAGMFSLNRDGYVVSNTNARLQGYGMSGTNLVAGVLTDLRVETGTQAPQGTEGVTAGVNLPANAKVLQQLGSMTQTDGLAVGVAQVGLPRATRSVLGTFDVPLTVGAPATFQGNAVADNIQFRSDPITFPAGGLPLQNFDIGIGGGPLINLSPIPSSTASSMFELVNAINRGVAGEPTLAGRVQAEVDPSDGTRIRLFSTTGRQLDLGGSSPSATFNMTGVPALGGGINFPFTDNSAIEISLNGPYIDGTLVESITPFSGVTMNSVQDMVNALNSSISSNPNLNGKVRAVMDSDNPGRIQLLTAGIYASDGTNMTVSPGAGGPSAFDALNFNATTPDVLPGAGSPLFRNGGINLQTIEGTPVSVQGNQVAGLTFQDLVLGTPSRLTGGQIVSFPMSAAGSVIPGVNDSVVFVSTVSTGTETVNLTIPSPNGWPSYNAFRADLQTAFNSAYGSASLAPQVGAALVGGRIQITDPTNGSNQITIQHSLSSTGTAIGIDANNLGLTNAQGAATITGASDTQPNNVFTIEKLGTPAGTAQITIPSGSYSNAGQLAAVINTQIDASPAIRGLVSVEAINGRLVFSTTELGNLNGNGLNITGNDDALDALGHITQSTPPAIDPQDKRHSFRINLSVPLPDPDNRSGSVEISLNENLRTIEQLAAAINRELASVDVEDYIGVEARITLDAFGNKKLEFVATQAGEASVISISNVRTPGVDITEEEIYAMLQIDRQNTDLLTQGQPAISNGYPDQSFLLTSPNGDQRRINIPENSSAAEISGLLSDVRGIKASAETKARILAQDFTHSGNMTIYLNTQPLTARTLPQLVDEINRYGQTTLSGTEASLDPETGDLLLVNQLGIDLLFEIESNTVIDSILVQGGDDTAPVVLGGTLSDDRAARVGGSLEIILDQGYSMSEPDPRVAGLFNGLTPASFSEYIINEFDPSNPETYNETASITIFDSLGNPHRLQLYYVKDAVDPDRPFDLNTWTVYAQVDGRNVGDPDSSLPFPENQQPTLASYKMYFNADGTLDTQATGDFLVSNWVPMDDDGNPNGSYRALNMAEGGTLPIPQPNEDSNFRINVANSSQYGSPFARNTFTQDGFASGRLKDIQVDDEGNVFARYTNGEAQLLGQVALASFVNDEGLTPVGSTYWAQSFESGDPTVGEAGSGTFGRLRASALEESTVDLAEQLVHLIIAQRNYQANAKTIETANATTQTIINLR